jgi:2-hydroxy-3-keto-5-methylthiopentenyl-1-phosphate phosphatase
LTPDRCKFPGPIPLRTPFSPAKQTHWIVDFDGTITERDTIGHLVNISAAGNLNTLSNWRALVSLYDAEFSEYFTTQVPSVNTCTLITHEKELLEGLRPIEERSLARVFDCGIFSGITGTELENGAWELIDSKQINLRPGCQSFLENVSRKGAVNKLSILSVNWSSIFVCSCIEAACTRPDPDTGEDKCSLYTVPEVYANELAGTRFHSNDRSTGEITSLHTHKFLTGVDKLRQMKHIRDEVAAAQCVYIGDGWADLLALLEADFGICIRDEHSMSTTQQMLADALKRLEKECLHLDQWTPESASKIWWARDFEEIMNWWIDVEGADSSDDDGDGDNTILPSTEGNAS